MRRVFFFFIWLLPIIPPSAFFLPSNACADGVAFRGDFSYTNSDLEVTNKSTDEKINSDLYRFRQRYNFNLFKTIYPLLTFRAGTHFELDNVESKTEGSKVTREERTLRPFVELTMDNRLYQASLSYTRLQKNRDVTDIPNEEDVRDTFTSFLGWNPVGLPRTTLRYSQIYSSDDPKTVDDVQKSLILETDYDWRELRLRYSYTRLDTDDKLNDFDTLDQTHFGKIEYLHGFLDGRLTLNTGYRIQYNTFRFSQGATAEVPRQRAQGLFSLDNTPADGPALAVNNALIDGNLIASAGIDIGLAGDETTLTNIGLDFGFAVAVDQIRVWVDRRLSNVVANSFSWDVYTSPDNTNNSTWTLITTVSPADFGTFDNRFEILFPPVTTRFIKVVTTPLSPTVPDANNFPNIFVTEMQAFITASDQTSDNKITTTDQQYELGLTSKLSRKTVVGYNLFVSSRKEDQGTFDEKRSLIANDLYVNHVFSRIFSGSARLGRTDSDEDDEDTVTYDYSAFLRGAYLRTFNQTIAFSGTHEIRKDDSKDTKDELSLTLRNNATLYRNWTAFLDAAYRSDRPLASDRKQKSIVLKTGTNIQPNRKLTINMNYQWQRFLNPDQKTEYDYDINVFFLPVKTLSFNARLQWIKRVGSPLRKFQNYNVNWSPFPDGNLQFFFNYSESFRSEGIERERSIGPGLNWIIGPYCSFEMFYTFIESESNTQEIKNHRLFAELRINF